MLGILEVPLKILLSLVRLLSFFKEQLASHMEVSLKKSRNGDTLGPVELNVGLYQGNQGDRREQDDQGEVSLIIFGMSESSGF